jgi:type II secretory pathway component PulM
MGILRSLLRKKSLTLRQRQANLRKELERKVAANAPVQDILAWLDKLYEAQMQQVKKIDIRPACPDFKANIARHKTKMAWANFISNVRWDLYRVSKSKETKRSRKARNS